MVLTVAVGGAGPAPRGAGPQPSTRRIEITHLRYRPARLAVSPGDTLVWVNRDVVAHTVTALDRSWDSGHLAPGDEWRMVVEEAGETRYDCGYHPTMTGSWVAGSA